MAQESPVVAAMETAESSPSPSKRRNRKKGGQRDADAAQETAAAVSPIASPSSMEVATGDLISLPSPVARAATDVFETAEHKKMEEQLGGLSLNTHDLKPPQEMPPIIQVETKAEPPPKLDGLLQLSLHQSSGRVPRTPPSSPETFMVHSPDKGYPRVSPVSPDIQVPSTMEDTFMGNTVTTEGFSAVAEQAEVEEFFDEIWPVAESEGTVGAGVEQETASLSNTLADMTLTNTDVPSNGFAQAEAPIQMPDEAVVAVNDAAFTSKDAFEVSSHTTEECVQNTVSVQDSLSGGVVPCAPVVEKPVEISSRQPPMASNGTASMSPLPVNQVTSTSEMANSAVSGTSQTSKPTMKVNQPGPVGGFQATIPVQSELGNEFLELQNGVTTVSLEPSQPSCRNYEDGDISSRDANVITAIATVDSRIQLPVETTVSASGSNGNVGQVASKALSDMEPRTHRTKRKSDTTEQDLHDISTAVLDSSKTQPVKTTAPASGGDVGGLKQDVSKASLIAGPQLRRAKRKGDASEQDLDAISAAHPVDSSKPRPVKTTSSASGGDTGNFKQDTLKASSESQSRRAKRKGDATDVKPPPAPVASATTRIAGAKPIGARGVAQNRPGSKAEVKAQPAVLTNSAQNPKNVAMKKPTATSIARAAAAEARRAVAKSSAVKRAPVRKPLIKPNLQQDNLPYPPMQTNTTISIPAPVAIPSDDGEGMRNVKRRLNASDADAASRRLYEGAKEAKLRKDALRAELQETYTFAPQVNAFKRRTNAGEAEEPNQDRFTRLHAQAKALQEKKRELQQQHEREGCTFTPTISARAKRLSHPGTGPRYENLYKNAQEIKQKREEKLLEKAKTTEEECPFKPKIMASKSKVKARPLYDSEREKQKRLDLEQKKVEAEMSECTFKPKVSTKRLKSKVEDTPNSTAGAALPDANPYNRLYQASIQRTERLEKLRHERDEKEKSQTPFQPKITASRSRLPKDRAKVKQPFHKRLYSKDYMQKVDAAREQRRLEGEQQFTFKPEINEPPEEIKAKVKERADSPGKNIFERLYDEKDKLKEKIELGEELRLQKEMAECTFRPQIEGDAGHPAGEAAPPVWERLLNYDKAQVIEEREKLKEQLEMQECTFKPELKSPDIPLKRDSSGNIFDRLSGTGNANVVTKSPKSSPGRQSPDMKGVSVGQIIKSTTINQPTDLEQKPLTWTYSISQPSSVNKQLFQRSTSFSGPKSESSSPTPLAGDAVLNGTPSQVGGSQDAAGAVPVNDDSSTPQSVLQNYDSWSTTLEAKMRNL